MNTFQGFLSLLKEKFSRNASRDNSPVDISRGANGGRGGPDQINSANVTPEMVRRRINATDDEGLSTRRTSTPEVIRIRTTSEAANTANGRGAEDAQCESNNAATVEVIRHGTKSEADGRKSKPILPSGAEVVRHKEPSTQSQQRPLTTTSTASSGGQMPQFRQVRVVKVHSCRVSIEEIVAVVFRMRGLEIKLPSAL
jgi:hypothetical protein